MKLTTYEEFVELARRGTFVPVSKEIMADLITPVSAFVKIAEHSDYAFLLESVEGGERMARYSFLGKDPFLVLRARDGKTIIERSGTREETAEPFVTTLRGLMADFQAPYVPDLPRFTGGAVGFLGYDASPWFEPSLTPAWASIEARAGASTEAREDEAGFMLFDTVLAFDHVKHRILVIANARITPDEDLEALYQFACAKIQFLERELERALSQPAAPRRGPSPVTSNVPRDAFEEGVRSLKEHIAAGDIYQAVLSQRFDTDVTADPFTIYRALRHVNPSPYMYFLRMGGLSIVGSSPEMLVRVEGRRVETHPIAGTRPRGRSEEDDLRLAEELKRNEKERAEHVMLVDLGRNDLGRVCEYGSVRVPQFMANRAVLARDASRLDGGGTARRNERPARRARRVLPGRNRVRRAEDPRHGAAGGVGADAARYLRRRGRLPRLRREPRLLHHDSDDHHPGRTRIGAGGRRDRRRLQPRRRVPRRPATRRRRCFRRLRWRNVNYESRH